MYIAGGVLVFGSLCGNAYMKERSRIVNANAEKMRSSADLTAGEKT
jgi:hypothetical protein